MPKKKFDEDSSDNETSLDPESSKKQKTTHPLTNLDTEVETQVDIREEVLELLEEGQSSMLFVPTGEEIEKLITIDSENELHELIETIASRSYKNYILDKIDNSEKYNKREAFAKLASKNLDSVNSTANVVKEELDRLKHNETEQFNDTFEGQNEIEFGIEIDRQSQVAESPQVVTESKKEEEQYTSSITPNVSITQTTFLATAQEINRETFDKINDKIERYIMKLVNSDYFTAHTEDLDQLRELEPGKALDDLIQKIADYTYREALMAQLSNEDEEEFDRKSFAIDAKNTLAEVNQRAQEVQQKLTALKMQRNQIIEALGSTGLPIDLVACDADRTLVAGHLHHSCVSYLKSHGDLKSKFELVEGPTGSYIRVREAYAEMADALWDELYKGIKQNPNNEIFPTGSKKEWQELFSDIDASNMKLAIVSFTYFAPILKRFLMDEKDGIGLSAKEMEKLVIVTGLPNEQGSKEQHIEAAREQHKLPKGMATTLLADDTIDNVKSHRKSRGIGLHLPLQRKMENPRMLREKLKGRLHPRQQHSAKV